MGHEPSDDDEDSLFGSPAPSRSPSPVLALPTAGQGVNIAPGAGAAELSAQNVGAIALPGSQHYSELRKDPLAPSLSQSTRRQQQCLAHSSNATRSNLGNVVDRLHDLNSRCGDAVAPLAPSVRTSRTSTPSTTTRSRASSASTSGTTTQTKKKKKKLVSQEPERPSITLPDSSSPPPPNFLRNQTTLLGTAGLVARIKPANFTAKRRVTRGSTSTNPIVVDDEEHNLRTQVTKLVSVARRDKGGAPVRSPSDSSITDRYECDAPRLGKRSGSATPSVDINPVLLPAPTNQEIVAMLIGQKDIFPVLNNILRLIAGQRAGANASANAAPSSLNVAICAPRSQQAPTTGPPLSTTPGLRAPPLKRRKLNRVPAGAADWDVPYPFQEGEGPEEYRRTWERERAKQLISQLVNLVRIAARKAATKKYYRNLELKCDSEAAPQQGSHRSARFQSLIPSSRTTDNADNVQSQDAHGTSEGQTLPQNMKATRPAVHAQETKSTLPEPSLSINIPSPPDLTRSTASPVSTLVPTPVQETPLDQLICSLMAASSTNSLSATETDSSNELFPSPSMVFVNTDSGEDVNQGLIDSWMSVFQSFPIPMDGFQYTSPGTPTTHSGFSSPGSNSHDFHDTFNLLDMHTPLQSNPSHDNIDTTAFSLSEHSGTVSSSFSNSMQDAEQFMRDIGLSINSDYAESQNELPMQAKQDITPGVSEPQPLQVLDINNIDIFMNNNIHTTVVAENEGSPPVPSPMPSTSSASPFGDTDGDPSTPNSSQWNSTPEIVLPPTCPEMTSQGMLRRALWNQFMSNGGTSILGSHSRDRPMLDEDDLMVDVHFTVQQKGKSKTVEPIPTIYEEIEDSSEEQLGETVNTLRANSTPPFNAPMDVPLACSTSVVESHTAPATATEPSHGPDLLPSLSTAAPSTLKKGSQKLNKQDILRRARERRQQIVEELDRVKVRLREAMVEEAALVETLRQRQMHP
ncbi:hypothetical protein AMATHDRAFT_1700 [Amanita thiersii Skay4041]|uniref:Uncharacterized protein n=1 Tax=Amanita thiersii Skay4041 TaxID=703135 RepID=A0A2A9NS88_9AGAR|nr:hypothetical protein AMATHDRAFT_1700 [Amanita thiersii Skay4041]